MFKLKLCFQCQHVLAMKIRRKEAEVPVVAENISIGPKKTRKNKKGERPSNAAKALRIQQLFRVLPRPAKALLRSLFLPTFRRKEGIVPCGRIEGTVGSEFFRHFQVCGGPKENFPRGIYMKFVPR
jgi:hypothetical protein